MPWWRFRPDGRDNGRFRPGKWPQFRLDMGHPCQPVLAPGAPAIKLGLQISPSPSPFPPKHDPPKEDPQMSYVEASDVSLRKTGQIKLHGQSGFAGMRKAGALVAKCLDELTDIVQPGIVTSKIDEFVRDFAFGHGAYPATLMYRGYRYSTCTSINHVVCHGMPGDRVLKEGDIVNVDVTFIVEGWYGDSSRMYAIGPIAYIRLESPYQPSTMKVTSTLTMSPSFSARSPGMPWQTTWLIEVQVE